MTMKPLSLILISAVFAVLGALGASAVLLSIDRHEFFDLPGLAYAIPDSQANPTSLQEQDGEDGEDAMQMYWADNLVRGKPYSASVVSDSVETLADGNTIRRHWARKYFRDSEGRLRLERPYESSSPPKPSRAHVELFIDDPIGNKSYSSDGLSGTIDYGSARQKEFLWRFAKAKGAAVLSLPKLDDKNNVRQTGMGIKEIEGLKCRGMREDVTIPAGLIGNEHAIAISSEIWFAPSIEAVVQSTVNDPRFGQIHYGLTNIQLKEQPLELFQLPPRGPSKGKL